MDQFNAPEWVGVALPLAALIVVATALVTLIVGWRRNRDRDR